MKDAWFLIEIFKAVLIRCLFTTHAFVCLWRVTEIYDNPIYWLLGIFIVPLIGEMLHIVFIRRGEEWNLWFCPSFLLYLMGVVPSIWYLELHKLEGLSLLLSRPGGTNETADISCEESLHEDLDSVKWVNALEQTLMVLLILGRWLLPRGELSHEDLSQILFVYLAYATDILELLEIFKETSIISATELVYATMFAYTTSLLQFVLRLPTGPTMDPIKANRSKFACVSIFNREVLGGVIELSLQDLPFLIVRLISITQYGVITYTNIFFTVKNAVVIILQSHKLIVYMFVAPPKQEPDYSYKDILDRKLLLAEVTKHNLVASDTKQVQGSAEDDGWKKPTYWPKEEK